MLVLVITLVKSVNKYQYLSAGGAVNHKLLEISFQFNLMPFKIWLFPSL